MNEVTAEFHRYDLEEINLEYLKYASEDEKENILPKTIGGSKVHLLLGIKNTKIQPVLIKVLPSGVRRISITIQGRGRFQNYLCWSK